MYYYMRRGTGYGSNILNLEKSTTINVKTGKEAQLKPIVTDGKISYVEVQTRGREYTSAPDLEIVGVGTGFGAKLGQLYQMVRLWCCNFRWRSTIPTG